MKTVILIISTFVFLVGCKGTDDASAGAGTSSSISLSPIRVSLTSSNLSSASLKISSASCTLTNGSINLSGKCYTPISLKGKVAELLLSNSFGGSEGPSRLISFNATEPDTGNAGPLGALGLAEFDFSKTAKATNKYSEDNIQDGGGYFDRVNILSGAFELKIEIPSGNSNVTDKFWTIRYMLYPRNPLDITVVNSCITETPIRTEITSTGNLYASPTDFLQGDILVCKKSSSSATCADTDFKYIDSNTGALSATRLTNTVRLAGSKTFSTPTCGGDGHTYDLGGSAFHATLSPGVHVVKTRSTAECFYKYSLRTNCTVSSGSGSCSDTAKEGYGIDVSVSYNLENSVFVDNSVDLASGTEVSILKNLDKVLPKPLALENTKTAEGTGYDTKLNAAVTITIDNTIASDALVARGESASKYDENFCFIKNQ